MRPAWAHSCGCKSRRKLITTNEVKRNCVRVTDRGKEAWSIICEPMNKNWIEGAAKQGEGADDREALVIKAKWRKSGGCAEKECVLTWGDLASWLKGRRWEAEREVSRGHSSCHFGAKGRRNGRSSYRVIESGESQMFINLKLVIYPARVKPSMAWQRDNQSCRTRTGETGSVQEGLPIRHLNHSNRPVRTRMPGGVGGVQPIMAAPYPDSTVPSQHRLSVGRTKQKDTHFVIKPHLRICASARFAFRFDLRC